MPVIVCPNCRERMSVERGDLGERVVCPDCDHSFTARADPADGGDERGDDGRRPVRGRDADPPQKKGKSNSLLWIILALVSVFIVLPCLGCVGVLIYFNTAKASFPATWGDHTVDAVEGGAAPVTAAFPVAPVGGLLKDAVNGGSGA